MYASLIGMFFYRKDIQFKIARVRRKLRVVESSISQRFTGICLSFFYPRGGDSETDSYQGSIVF